MRNLLLVPVAGLCAIALACGGATTSTEAPAEPEASVQAVAEEVSEAPADEVQPAKETVEAVRHDVLYVCNCGPTCDCKTVSTKPGTCACGKELTWAHVVKIEGDEALLCTCAEGCRCTIDANDATKCSCGNELRRVSLKGTGVYFCNCGGSCTCNYVSDAPGTCTCGMELTTSV